MKKMRGASGAIASGAKSCNRNPIIQWTDDGQTMHPVSDFGSSHFSRYRMQHHHIATDRQPAIASTCTGTTYSSRVQRVLLYTRQFINIVYCIIPIISLVSRKVPGSRTAIITAASASTIMGRRRISIRSTRTSTVTIS